MVVITKEDLVKEFRNKNLHRITKKQIKKILDAGEYIFVLDHGWYGNIWGGRTEINYDYAFWHNSNSWDMGHENAMTKEETIDYIYKYRTDIEDIRDRGGLWRLSRAKYMESE